MYQISRAIQRGRQHSESALSLFDYGVEVDPYGPLTRCGETELQDDSEIVILSEEEVDCILFLFLGEMTVSSDRIADHMTADSLLIFHGSTEDAGLRLQGGPRKSRFLQLTLNRSPGERRDRTMARQLNPKDRRGTLQPVASGQGHVDAALLASDSAVYLSHLRPREQVVFETLIQRRSYVYVLEGTLRVENERLHPGDSLRTDREAVIPLSSSGHCQFVLVDLPPSEAESDNPRAEKLPLAPDC